MIYPQEQIQNLKSLEDSSPWREAKRGWRVETLNEEQSDREFTFSVVEAEINKDIEYECGSDDEGLLLRVCIEGSGKISTGGVSQEYFPNMMVGIQFTKYGKIKCHHTKGRQKFINFRFI